MEAPPPRDAGGVVPRVGKQPTDREVIVSGRVADIAGTLTLPSKSWRGPLVIVVGGTLSQTRDGGLLRERAPERRALQRLAGSLAAAGYGSYRYDKTGVGGSRAKAGWTDTYQAEAICLADVLAYFRGMGNCTELIVAGESAGAYVACLAARAGVHADGYLFLGGFCGKGEEIFEYNYGNAGLYGRALHGPEIDPKTADSPERLHLAPGVTIVEDILAAARSSGVDTAEGRIGPLLRSDHARAHYIDMPGGMYLEEHPHAKGSIIYTVRGEWGLESLGRWHHMKPGSLYWFGDNIPTGYQVPFTNDAFILIFKATPGDDDHAFLGYLRELQAKLNRERTAGAVFRLADLPIDHAALSFARSVNPNFDADLFNEHTDTTY